MSLSSIATTPLQAKKPVVVKLNPVKSSMVEATGYDPLTKTLAVQFRGGKTYHYDNVPTEVVDAMGKAESLGKFIGAHIRGKYETKLLSPK